MMDYPLIYAWGNNPVRASLRGMRCRIVVTGRMGSALVEMADGRRVVTSRRAVRRVS